MTNPLHQHFIAFLLGFILTNKQVKHLNFNDMRFKLKLTKLYLLHVLDSEKS
jgi:hypothetical protein